MAKKSQKNAAARARAQRLAQISRKITNIPNSPEIPESPKDAKYGKLNTALHADSNTDSDCEYIGGINHDHVLSDDEDWISESDCSDSLSELEGSGLEESLEVMAALQVKVLELA